MPKSRGPRIDASTSVKMAENPFSPQLIVYAHLTAWLNDLCCIKSSIWNSNSVSERLRPRVGTHMGRGFNRCQSSGTAQSLSDNYELLREEPVEEARG